MVVCFFNYAFVRLFVLVLWLGGLKVLTLYLIYLNLVLMLCFGIVALLLIVDLELFS